MKSRQNFFDSLQTFVTNEGAPLKLISDNASEMANSTQVHAYLRRLHIPQGFTEPYMPHQNRAERAIQHVKAIGCRLMDKAPRNLWCFAIQFAAELSNIQARKGLNWRTPFERRKGHTPDISHLQLSFFEEVFYYAPERKFPHPRELPGRILGPAFDTGDALCFYVLTSTNSIIVRSIIRARDTNEAPP
ncbi:MAG: hypothetical protein AAGM67_21790, partial [Bacteroidota bacterium]